MGLIGLDLHAAAASVTLLSAPEIAVQKILVYGQACRQAGEECNQGFAVGFPGSEVAQHKQLILTDECRRDEKAKRKTNGFYAVTMNSHIDRINCICTLI